MKDMKIPADVAAPNRDKSARDRQYDSIVSPTDGPQSISAGDLAGECKEISDLEHKKRSHWIRRCRHEARLRARIRPFDRVAALAKGCPLCGQTDRLELIEVNDQDEFQCLTCSRCVTFGDRKAR